MASFSAVPDVRGVIAQHGDLVYGMCRRLAVDPDDCYQEIWLKILRALPSFDPSGPAPLRAFVATIARRHLVDQHRREVVRDKVARASEPALGFAPPDVVIEHIRDRARLEDALSELAPDQRHVVVQHHVHGVPLEQLATEEGVALGTIKSRLHRGRARLAEQLRRSP